MTNSTPEYMKEWRKNHAKHIKEYEERNRERRLEYMKRWYQLKKERDFKKLLKKAA
jgi:hypothetical protein